MSTLEMDLQHLNYDDFFEKLGELFSHRKGSDHGAIYLSQKRLTYDHFFRSPTTGQPLSELDSGRPMPIIVRASNGKSKRAKADKVKLSTIVQPHDLEAFYARYAEVCKTGMSALKPRDRSKKKSKAKKKKAAP